MGDRNYRLLSKNGFTLIEVLITLAILAILVAIAVPVYTGYIRNTKRTEAKSNLQALRLLLEQYYAENGQYCKRGDTCTTVADYTYTENDDGSVKTETIITGYLVGFKPKSASATTAVLYDYSINPSSNTAYVITASPVTARGAPSGNLCINQDGNKNLVGCISW